MEEEKMTFETLSRMALDNYAVFMKEILDMKEVSDYVEKFITKEKIEKDPHEEGFI